MNLESKIYYDLAVIGGGPAGVAAGVYAARKKIKTVFITESFRNQSVVSDNIQNWIGTVSISGEDLAKNLEKHLKSLAGDIIDIKEKETATNITKNNDGLFTITTDKNIYNSRTILIASGSVRRKIKIKGAEKFEGKGITYCATCDGPMFADMDIAVIGGGNSAFESASQLLAYAKSVTILQRSDFKADPITIKKVLSNPKARGISNVDLIEVKGDKFVSGIVYKDKTTDKIIELPVQGIFIEIGANPSVEYIKDDIVELDDKEQIIVDPKTQKTSCVGIWSAGDCTDGLYKQNNIAVGDAIKALEDIFRYLKG
ncbi:MAG: FAD-dependent oxidoreductase [Candidatus Taylorbacteria bacterium]|nr:FAD-dependent oxidoreductase [Candidatus Taylorbacteria bacterium]